jgi:hypothetical protein
VRVFRLFVQSVTPTHPQRNSAYTCVPVGLRSMPSTRSKDRSPPGTRDADDTPCILLTYDKRTLLAELPSSYLALLERARECFDLPPSSSISLSKNWRNTTRLVEVHRSAFKTISDGDELFVAVSEANRSRTSTPPSSASAGMKSAGGYVSQPLARRKLDSWCP